MMRRSRVVRLTAALLLSAVLGALWIAPATGAGSARAVHAPMRRALRFRGTTVLGALPRRSGTRRTAWPRPSDAADAIFSRHIGPEEGEAEAPTPASAPGAGGVPVKQAHPEVVRSVAALDVADQVAANGGDPFTAVEPPDQGLCVGNGFVLETVNSVIQVFSDRGKALTAPVDNNTFYGYPKMISRSGFGPLLADPSCLYDKDTGRWFHVVLTLDVDPSSGDLLGPNRLDIAVSRTSDPTKRWDLYSIPTQNDGTGGTPDHGCVGANDTGHGPCVGDYPQIGLDRHALVITTNEYTLFGSTQFTGANLYAMSKRRLAAGGSGITAFLFGPLAVPELDEPAFTVLPANGGASDWSSARDGTMFFVSTTASSFELGGDGTSRTLVVWALSNTARLDAAAAPRLRHDVVGVQRYAMPPPAEQRPGDIPLQECLNADCFGFGTPPTPETLKELDAGDSRTGDATISGGTLVAVWGTAVRIGGATRDGVAYAEIDPSFTGGGLSADVGLHGALAASDQNLLEPSVALGTSGTGFIGLSITGPNRFPSVGYAAYELGRRPQLIRIATPGRGPDDGFTGTFLTAPDTRARWGDYGAAVPGAGGTIWIATEYIGQTCTLDEYRSSVGTCGGTRTALANWGTRLVRLDVR